MHIYEQITRERGEIANIHEAFGAFEEGVSAHYKFYKDILLREDLPLSRFEREYLAFKTSQSNECQYCISHHEKAFENYSPDESISKKRTEFFDLACETLTKTPHKAVKLKNLYRKHGISDAEYAHIVMVVSYFNFANRLAFSMDLNLELDFEKTCH